MENLATFIGNDEWIWDLEYKIINDGLIICLINIPILEAQDEDTKTKSDDFGSTRPMPDIKWNIALRRAGVEDAIYFSKQETAY